MKAYIPNNLNLGAEKHSDKYYYIITLIYYGRIFDKRIKKDSFIPLNGQVLHKILGGYYIKYLRWLIENGIIESDKNYLPDKKSIGYRLTEKYRYVRFKKIEITNEKLISKINWHKNLNEDRFSNSTISYLYDCLRKVNIDSCGAFNWIEQNITDITQFDYFTYTCSVDLLLSNDYYITNSSKSGRIFTNITNFPSDLRKYLSYEGKSLVEIDLANSQPFFLNFLILDYLSKEESNQGNIYLSYDTKNNLPDDVKKYIDLTSKGNLYEYLMEAFSYSGNKKHFKKILFSRVFYNDNDLSEYEEWSIFKDLFPTVSEVIAHHKKGYYQKFSHLLQKAEADIMIYKIIPKLEAQNIFVLTIHDSYLTTPENSEIVKKFISEEFKNQYGLIPTVRIKRGEE